MNLTKYIITSPECTDVLPSDISTVVYESKLDVSVKETCFGAIISGEEDAVNSVVREIRSLDPSGIFVKGRGYPPGDSRRCRGSGFGHPNKAIALAFGRRAGGVRPGCCMIECEAKMLPLISRALASQSQVEKADEKSAKPERKLPLEEWKVEEIIKDEFS